MADLSQFSTADLEAMAKGDLGSVSDQGLQLLHDAAQGGPSAGEALGRGAVQGATLGFGDELSGLGGALGTMAGSSPIVQARDPALQAKLERGPTFGQAYRETRDEARAANEAARAAHPWLYGGAEIAGSALPMAAGGMAAKAAGMAVGPVAGSAATGAAMAAGGSNADLTQGEGGQFAIDTGIGAGVGAVIPPVVDVAGAGARKLGQGAGALIRKLFASGFSIPEKNIGAYMADRAGINAAPDVETIKTGIDAEVEKLKDAVDAGKMSVKDAKIALGDMGFQTGIDTNHAETMYKQAAAAVIQPIKDTPAPTAIAHDIVNAVDDLKQSVISRANEAWKPLEASTQTLPTKVVKGQVTQAINGLKIGGAQGGAVGQQSQAAIASLQALRDQLDGLPAKLPMTQVKQIVQNLDRDITYVGRAGEFMDPASQEKLGIRRGLDQYMKRNVPGYAQAMAPVAQDTDLLHQVSKPFGDEMSAINRLGPTISGPKGALIRQQLEKLEQATGRQGAFTGPIDQYTRAQAILKDPKAVEALQQAVPEYQAYQKALQQKDMMTPQWKRTEPGLASAQAKLEQAQQVYEPVSRLKPGSTESAIRSFGRPAGPPIETRNALQALDQQAGTSFTKQAEQRALLDSFGKNATRGSRNTLLGGAIGAAVHMALGGGIGGGIEGFMGGAAVGRLVMDEYGPKAGKMILDQIGKLSEKPSIKTIRNMSLPPAVKQDMERAFNMYWLDRDRINPARSVAGKKENQKGKTSP
jgi:hypothetical protein